MHLRGTSERDKKVVNNLILTFRPVDRETRGIICVLLAGATGALEGISMQSVDITQGTSMGDVVNTHSGNGDGAFISPNLVGISDGPESSAAAGDLGLQEALDMKNSVDGDGLVSFELVACAEGVS